ncbi:hypothetical protein [Caldimonas mangrovi]|uniref:hypothetical protein n=1 Tax=Caldimonas mangrovi TaxID=2944811 RepID=UPI0020437622|nr:hypothetical protein [Caldimonas mangrovi]
MAAGEAPGPLCSLKSIQAVNDGTTARTASPAPGTLCSERAEVYAHTQTLVGLLSAGQGTPASEALIADYRRRIQTQRTRLALRALRDMKEIRREVWVTLNREQRIAALREVHRIYAAAFGMAPSAMSFERLPPNGRATVYGVYVANERLLKVEERLIEPMHLRPEQAVVELVCTVVHESRHYLQWRVLRRPNSFPSFWQAKEWADDYSRTSDPSGDPEGYRKQPVEADAFAVEELARAMLYPDTLSVQPYAD